MSAKNSNVTPADVAELAAKEKLITVVPEQTKAETGTITPDETKDIATEGVKKSFKERVQVAKEKLKEHKTVVIAVSVSVGIGVIAYVRNQALKAAEETVAEDEKQDILDEINASELGG